MPAAAQAQIKPTEKPFLWKVETDPPTFLYGTAWKEDETQRLADHLELEH